MASWFAPHQIWKNQITWRQQIWKNKITTNQNKTSEKGEKSEEMGREMRLEQIKHQFRQPKTVSDLILHRKHTGRRPTLATTKAAASRTVLGSLGPVKVMMVPESKVGDLVAPLFWQYLKEGAFDLHYSQFNLENESPDKNLFLVWFFNHHFWFQ